MLFLQDVIIVQKFWMLENEINVRKPAQTDANHQTEPGFSHRIIASHLTGVSARDPQ